MFDDLVRHALHDRVSERLPEVLSQGARLADEPGEFRIAVYFAQVGIVLEEDGQTALGRFRCFLGAVLARGEGGILERVLLLGTLAVEAGFGDAGLVGVSEFLGHGAG